MATANVEILPHLRQAEATMKKLKPYKKISLEDATKQILRIFVKHLGKLPRRKTERILHDLEEREKEHLRWN